MPVDVGVSIEKTTAFRGFQQPFANVYYFRSATADVNSVASMEALLDFLVSKEKLIHASVVNFTRGRVWNTNSGSQAGNQMRVDKALSGTGANGPAASMDKERALLVQWPAGLSSTNKPVKLRKFYHICGAPPNGVQPSSGVLANTDQIAQTDRTSFLTALTTLRTITAGGNAWELMAKSGRQPTGDPTIMPYLEHHQLGDQWR